MSRHALAICQARYDAAEPPTQTDFIDTAEGHNWASSASVDLLHFKPVMIGSRKVLGEFALADELALKLSDAVDHDGNIGVLLLAAATGDGNRAKAAFEAIMGRNYAEQLAYEMAAKHADEYAAQAKDDDYD